MKNKESGMGTGSLVSFAESEHEEIIFPVALVDVVYEIPEIRHD